MASRVTRATAPTAKDCPSATAVRPITAPIATAAAKSIAVHWARVRRWAIRNPTTAVPYISRALPTTAARSSVCSTSQLGMTLSFLEARRARNVESPGQTALDQRGHRAESQAPAHHAHRGHGGGQGEGPRPLGRAHLLAAERRADP